MEAARAFLQLLQDAFDRDWPGRVATLSSDRLDTGVLLSTGGNGDQVWSASAILDHAGNKPEDAVAWILTHLDGTDPAPEIDTNR